MLCHHACFESQRCSGKLCEAHALRRRRSMRIPVIMSWSGGKDCALALHELRRDPAYEVVELLTTIAQPFRRISHHGVRETLLEEQADAIGLPLRKIYLPSGDSDPCTNVVYEQIMGDAMADCRARGIFTVGF